MAEAFQSDAFQGDAFESITGTFSADAGALVLTGLEATFIDSNVLADAGALALAGLNADFNVGFTADVGALVLAGLDSTFNFDRFPHFISSWGPFASTSGVFLPGSMPSHQTDDIILLFLETNNEAVTVSGWTEAGASPAINAGTNPTRLTVFWKRATSGSESPPSTNSLTDHCIGTMLVYRDCINTGDPFDVTASDSGGTGTAISITGATTTQNFTRIITAVASTVDAIGLVTTFSAWTNSGIKPVVERVDGADSVGTGGAVGVADGYKITAGTYGTTLVTQTNAVEYATWTGALLPFFSNTFDADAGALVLTGLDATFSTSGGFDADLGALVLTGLDATFDFAANFVADPGELILTGLDVDFTTQIDQVFTLNFIVHALPAELAGNYRNFRTALIVDGNTIPIRSWQMEETAQSLSAKLDIELARNSDRSAITRTSAVDFALITNGVHETIFSNGYLKRKDYAVSRQGIGPDDKVTFTALPEMAARLNAVPYTNTVFFDPARHNVTASDFEGVYDKDQVYTPPVVTSVPSLDLYELFDRVLITECGFTDYVTNIPNFPVAIVEFNAGESWMNGLAGIIGMFEPELIPYSDGGPCIEIRDGTSGVPGGSPAPRDLTVSSARSLGVASDISIVDALLIHVTQESFIYDYFTDRVENTTSTEGTAGIFSTTYLTVSIATTYRDYFRTEHPDRPINTERVREVRTSVNIIGTIIHRSTENFYFDGFGRMFRRTKSTEALAPNPTKFVIGLNEVLYEEEKITYAMHPYEPRQYYVKVREIAQEGIILIDSENQQLGVDYSRGILDAYRAGNVNDAMTSDWAKISSFKEEITPLRNNFLRIRKVEIDWLANVKNEDRHELKQGEVGVNIFVQEQQRIYLFSPGETTINSTIESVNMGELPFNTAIALGERILRIRNTLPNRVSFDLIGIDNTLQKGTPITAKGRNGENLGVYVIEARTMVGNEDGTHFMTIQARQAD